MQQKKLEIINQYFYNNKKSRDKMKLKVILSLGIISVISLLLTGCGKKENNKEIEFLTNRTDLVNGMPDASGKEDPESALFKILAEKFKKETGITVKLTAYNDYHNAVKRRLASGDYGDVVTLADNNMNQKQIKTFFKPLGTKKELSDYLFLDNCAVGDEVYGLSGCYYISGLVYNKKVFADAGYNEFPKTLTELHDAFTKIKKNGKIPVILNRGENWPLGWIKTLSDNYAGSADPYNKMWMLNAPFSDKEPMGQSLKEAATWVNKGWVEKEFIKDWQGSITKIADGRAGMMILSSWALPQVQDRTASVKDASPSDIAFAAFPACDPYQSKIYALVGAGNSMVISKNSTNYEASKKWIEYIINSGIYDKLGGLPINKNNKDVNEGFKKVLSQMNSGEVVKLQDPPLSAFNGERTVTILKDMDMFADYKYIGKPLDEARKSMKNFNECIKRMNKQFNEIKKDRKY
jgi:raffinose/stachyose/melibiose transport system substrate-binding protein